MVGVFIKEAYKKAYQLYGKYQQFALSLYHWIPCLKTLPLVFPIILDYCVTIGTQS